MKKPKPKPTPTFEIHDFFGTTKDYYLFAVRSPQALLPLAAKLANFLQRDFSIVNEYQLDNELFTANFNVACCTWSKHDGTQLLLVENKTTNGETKVVSKTERHLNFRTLSLFEDFYYIFNADGMRIEPWQFADVDFLCLIYTKKEFGIAPIREKLVSCPFIKCEPAIEITDAPRTLTKEEKKVLKNDLKALQNIKNLILELETFAMQFRVKSISKLLAPNQTISAENSRLLSMLCANGSATFSSEEFDSPYLQFLTSE